MAGNLSEQALALIREFEGLLSRVAAGDVPAATDADFIREEIENFINTLKIWRGDLKNITLDDATSNTILKQTKYLQWAIKLFAAALKSPDSTEAIIKCSCEDIRQALGDLNAVRNLAPTKPQHGLRGAVEDGHQANVDYFSQRLRSGSLSEERRAQGKNDKSTVYWITPTQMGQLHCLWDKIPEHPDLPKNSVSWLSNPEDVIFDSNHVSKTEAVLKAFCEAWAAITTMENKQVLEQLKKMSEIILILSIIEGGRNCLDRFLENKYTDADLPFYPNDLVAVFSGKRDAHLKTMFLAQQFRVVQRSWADGEHLRCYANEPLRLKVIKTLSTTGSFGEVDKVRDLSTNNTYARKRQRATPGAPEHWENEVRILKKICQGSETHHIVKFGKTYQRGADELGCLVTPAADSNLSNLLNHYCQVKEPQLAALLLRSLGCLSLGLKYLHKVEEVRHRDIKPDNILYYKHPRGKGNNGMEETEEFLWADFGLSKDFTPVQGSTTLSTTGFGTREYQAPETRKAGQSHGRAMDIFSFGCTFLEIINALLVGDLSPIHPHCVTQFQPYMDKVDGLRDWINARKVDRKTMPSPQVMRILDLAYRMIDENPDKRPTITGIVVELNRIASSTRVKLFCSRCETQLSGCEAELEEETRAKAKKKGKGKAKPSESVPVLGEKARSSLRTVLRRKNAGQ